MFHTLRLQEQSDQSPVLRAISSFGPFARETKRYTVRLVTFITVCKGFDGMVQCF